MKQYLLMLWDGLGFFGFDVAKLGRLKGEPVTYASKYKDTTKVSLTVSMIIFVIWVVITQVVKIGS